MAIPRPTWQDIITEHNVQTWHDWPWDTWLGPYVVISPRRYRVRVRVYRAGEWVDITHRVASGVIRESNDQPVATLELRLLNGRQYPSLAPRRKDSPLNQVNGQYVPLLWIGRLIAVEAAFSEDGSEPDEWWPVFLGELEDEIDTESGPDGTYVRLFCRDMAARLQRAYIAGPWTFENMYASQMIQAILDRAYSEGLIQEPVQLRLIGPDDFWVERYDIEYTDLWSALQRFCQQRGTDLRYRLNEQTGQIELTYWLPDRAMVPGWIIDASQIRREELRISGTDIINKVTVRYRDAATGQRAEVTVQDADSIAMYGLRHGLIEEPDTDLIPDAATAQKLAQTIVEDLKDVPALTRLTVPFDPRIQLFDKLRIANPNVRDEPEHYAIEERELQFSATDWSMVLIGGGRVVVKRNTWLERMATEGVKAPIRGDELRYGNVPGDRLEPESVTEYILDPAIFSIKPSSDPEPSSGSLEDLWDMDPNTGVTFSSAPITITFRYPVYQGSDLVDLHLGAAAQGYVQMRQRDTGQWVNVLGSPASPVQFSQGWNRVPFVGGKLYFGREYRLVLLNNVRVNELRFERVTVADKILAGRLRLTGDMAIEAGNNAVRIDGDGVWGYLGSTKRAGFGTDGRWIAGGGAIEADESGLRGKKGNYVTFEITSNGDAFFGGQIAAESILSNSSLLNALTDFDHVELLNSVKPSSRNWHNMPGMSLQTQTTRSTVLFIIIDTGIVGQAYQGYWERGDDGYWHFVEKWSEAQVRLLINGSVRFTSPWLSQPAPQFFITEVEAGTHNLQVQWRYDEFNADRNVYSQRRGIYVIKFGR